MGRFPRLRFDVADLAPIHAVFVSHAHSDHLDPYTLTRLWRELASPPVLLVPVTLSFLVPLFREYLDACQIRVLEAHSPVGFRGVDLLGFYDVGLAATNEDDVMVLVVRNASETVLIEADANLTLEDPELRSFVTTLLAGPGVESAVFLSTENELTGTLSSKDCHDLHARADLADLARSEMVDSVRALYAPVDADDLWHAPHLLRLVHGQGLTAPHELDPRWQRILFPVRIADRVREERAVVSRLGLRHHVDSLTVGSVHTITGGRIAAIEPLPGLELLDHDRDRAYDPDLEFFPTLPFYPLRFDERDTAQLRARILALLNDRFLPYLHGVRRPPVLHLLADHGGAYRVRVHYGRMFGDNAWDYVLTFAAQRFVEEPAGWDEPQETYWGNDLDDFLHGHCDEFTTFCRTQFPGQQIRVWACLATPLLNSDLVEKRVRHHFERARAGLTPGSYVMSLFEGG